MRNLVVTALAAATLAGAFAAPAAAADIVTVKVGYSDLDLDNRGRARTRSKTRIASGGQDRLRQAGHAAASSRPRPGRDCKESASSSAAEQFEKADRMSL